MTLKDEISKRGLTRKQAAEIIGIPVSTLDKWTMGLAPTIDRALYAMDRIRGVNLDEDRGTDT